MTSLRILGERVSAGKSGVVMGVLLVGLAALSLPTIALSQESAAAREGREIAIYACSPCHAVSKPVGPSFPDIANGPHASPEGLRDVLTSTHSDVSHRARCPTPD